MYLTTYTGRNNKKVICTSLEVPTDISETIRHAIDVLHKKHNLGNGITHLVVADDAKTCEDMLEAKRVYGSDLDLLLPYLVEWHEKPSITIDEPVQ